MRWVTNLKTRSKLTAGFGLVLFVSVWWTPLAATLPDTSVQATAANGRAAR